MKSPADFLEKFQAYYDPARKDYWIQDAKGDWIIVNISSLRAHLRDSGISSRIPDGEVLSLCDMEIIRIQKECNVAYAGELAGFKRGPVEVCGKQILVTTSPRLVRAEKGAYPLIDALLQGLFVAGNDAYHQLSYVLGWLRIAYEALLKEHRRPGQLLAIAGERDCGKSLLQMLITAILGGRVAKPYRYMSGGTDFNGELFCAEHLIIEDEIASTDLRTRRAFGARIKDFTVNAIQSCHAKNRQALSLTPFWRLSITLNDEPENLMILPPLDANLKDKVILLRANKRAMPMPTETIEERETFWSALHAEVPAFCHMLTQWRIPTNLRSGRFGIVHFHHPDLLEAIDAIAPESRLRDLIDTEIFRKSPTQVWRGTADELERFLLASASALQARRLLDWTNATGTYLGRLEKKLPHRFKSVHTNSLRSWEIQPPSVTP